MSIDGSKRCKSFSVTAISNTGEENEFVLGVDEILHHVGDFGRFQKLMLFLVSFLYIPIAFHPFLMYFATLVPSWRCRPNSTLCSFNGTFTGEDTRRCDMPRDEWTYTEDRLFSVVTQFDLSCDELWIGSLITFTYFAGWGIGALIIGNVSDRYGRKAPILPGVVVTLVVGLVNPFMPNVYLIVACSFILGFCYTAVETQSSILLSESVGTKWRPIASRLSTLMFPIAWIVLALKAYLLRNWRYLSLVCTLPYVGTIAVCWFIPESIRWLQTNGRPEEGRAVLAKIGAFNKQELSSKIDVSKNKTEKKETRSSMRDIFGSQFARKSLSLMCIWCFTIVCYYGLILGSSDVPSSDANVYKDFALVAVMEFPGKILAVVFCKKIGRKISSLVFLLIAGVCCLVIPLISKESATGTDAR